MASFDVDQLNKNSRLFLAVCENINISEKLKKIDNCLNEGANINAADANYYHNTPMHMAVIRAEPDVVRLLIEKGAALYKKNSTGKLPLDIAHELKNDEREKIVHILKAAGCQPHAETLELKNKQPKQNIKKPKQFLYMKRTGTSGVCGQLYETKLLSLVLLRAINDKDIEHFCMGTNINGIGDFDDICLRYKVEGYPKSIVIFLQAKHREDQEKGLLTIEDLTSTSGDFSLRKYFDSYMKIKSNFHLNNEDDLFDGEFNSVDCNLIIYTPAKELLAKKRFHKTLSIKVNELINTREDTEAFQFSYDDDDLDYLTKMTVEKRLTELGVEFLNLIMSKNKLQVIMVSELIAKYHVVMSKEVIQHIKGQEDGNDYRIWKFRPDFFKADSDYLNTLKVTFYNRLSKYICDKSDIAIEDRFNIRSMVENPCAASISKLIGKLVTYDGKKLVLKEFKGLKKFFSVNELTTLKANFNDIEVTTDVVQEATRLKLESLEFKLPLAFGNLDMTVRGDHEKVLNTINSLVDKLKLLFNKGLTIIEINDNTVGPKTLITDGIINIFGSAVGNLLVLDTKSKMLKFDIENTDLPVKGKLLLDEFRKYFSDDELSRYRIKMNRNKLPKASFHGDECDKQQAKEFLNNLWFYTNQGKENVVEDILKKYINNYYNNEEKRKGFRFKILSDAIFLKSHDAVQKWWMQSGKTPYLTRFDDFFETAKQAVIDKPLLTVLSFMFCLKIQNLDIRFNEESIRALELHTISNRLFNIVSEANLVSCIKIMQYFEKNDKNKSIYIDFDYVLSLPLTDFNKMLNELEQIDEANTPIIVIEKLKYNNKMCDKLMQILEKIKENKTILVSDSDLADEIKKKDCFIDQYQSVRDVLINLTDLDEPSQMKLLEDTTIVFQGEEVLILRVLNQEARGSVRTNILNKIIYKETMEIGHGLIDPAYKNVMDVYKERTLCRAGVTYKIKTFNDEIKDDVVVVLGRSGIGKSIMLSHLSHQTKLVHPLPWIVRVNLPEYENDFSRWHEQNTSINLPLALHFLCRVALKNFDMKKKLVLAQHNEKIKIAEVDSSIDSLALFELELFLNLFNEGKVIFLFDELYVVYHRDLVLKVLKLLKNVGIKMWITSCEYYLFTTALKYYLECGNLYVLDEFQCTEYNAIIQRFLSNIMKKYKLCLDQIEVITCMQQSLPQLANTYAQREHREIQKVLVNMVSLFLFSVQAALCRGKVGDLIIFLHSRVLKFLIFVKEYVETLKHILEETNTSTMNRKEFGEIFICDKLMEVPLRHANNLIVSLQRELDSEPNTAQMNALMQHIQHSVQIAGGIIETWLTRRQ